MINPAAIYRVFYRETFIGTAFAIAPHCFLTCKHLFDNRNKKEMVLRGSADYGDMGHIEWQEHPEQDCAFGITSTTVREYLTLVNHDCMNISETFEFKGYVDSSSSLQNWKGDYSGHNTIEGWLAIQGTYAEGMSGSPVFIDHQVVALSRGDNFNKNQIYIVPLKTIWDWLMLLSNQQGISLIKPITSEQKFVEDLYLNLRSEYPQVIFSQQGRNLQQIRSLFIKKAEQDFERTNILKLFPPPNNNCSEKNYFKQLAVQCGFEDSCKNSNHWAFKFSKRLKNLENSEKLFLFITDFEKGNQQLGQELAKHLHQLQTNNDGKLEIVIMGGEHLAKQVLVSCDMPFLNSACGDAKYLPELQLQDLRELNKNHGRSWNDQQLQKILEMTGGHPVLICNLLKQDKIPNHLDKNIVQRLFLRYRDNQKIKDYLKQEKIAKFDDWPKDKVVRNLYWNNLLVRKDDWLYTVRAL